LAQHFGQGGFVNDRFDIADAMAKVARTLEAPTSLEETLFEITHVARDTVPGVSAAGISILHRNGPIETVAATDQLVHDVDALQYEFGEGPCVDAIKAQHYLVVDDMAEEERWPKYAPRALEHGVRSQMGFQLSIDNERLGALNLYAMEPNAFDEEARHIGGLFATHASMAMGAARKEQQLNTALDNRKMIGQAIGLLMCKYELDEDRAFRFLLRVSQSGNIKLREVAREVVAAANDQARAKG
jgi:transcriptional regulator with GAF, ATPase, and Fis domain